MRFIRLLGLAAALALAVTLSARPAAAENGTLRWHFDRSTPIADSTLVTMLTALHDTTVSLVTQNLVAAALAGLDTSGTGVGYPDHAKKALAVIIEVTGTMTSIDSTYLAMDGTTDAGSQTTPTASRWVPLIVTYASAVVNNTGSQTFVFLLPADPQDKNSWVWWRAIRFRTQWDSNASAVGFSTRASYAWRSN